MLLAPVSVFVRKHGLLAPNQQLVVGVSGGPDSLALLHLLTRLRPEYDLRLRVAHLNHGLRPSADEDSEFVTQIAKAWDVPCTVERADVAAIAKAEHLSIEEAGRLARYAFFTRLGPVAAVAHNADDQAETVLMHLLRGSGLAGLRGMLPKRVMAVSPGESRLEIVRPLLGTSRADIEAYVAAHGLRPRIDPTNTDTTFFRNRLRRELLPFLETYNPNIRQILRRTAEVVAGEHELLRGLVEQTWNNTLAVEAKRQPTSVSPDAVRKSSQSESKAVVFDLIRWRALPLPLQRALLRQAINRLRPGLRDVDFTPVENAIAWLQTAESGHTADLLGGLCVKIVGSTLIVGPWSVSPPPQEARGALPEVSLGIPGATQFLDWQFTTEIVAASDPHPDRWTAFIPASFMPLTVRIRRPGDRFKPLGLNGHTLKLSDFMINRKIPATERDQWPLVVSGATVLWVCGYRLAEQANQDNSEKLLKILLQRLVT